ncbi:hypothetical protein LguiA_023974 [Lonicera macranthoides]
MNSSTLLFSSSSSSLFCTTSSSLSLTSSSSLSFTSSSLTNALPTQGASVTSSNAMILSILRAVSALLSSILQGASVLFTLSKFEVDFELPTSRKPMMRLQKQKRTRGLETAKVINSKVKLNIV